MRLGFSGYFSKGGLGNFLASDMQGSIWLCSTTLAIFTISFRSNLLSIISGDGCPKMGPKRPRVSSSFLGILYLGSRIMSDEVYEYVYVLWCLALIDSLELSRDIVMMALFFSFSYDFSRALRFLGLALRCSCST